MNIFEHHLSEIKKLIISEKAILKLTNVEDLQGINLEVPPEQFNFDLSCNKSQSESQQTSFSNGSYNLL